MRYLFGFLCVCALGLMTLSGCQQEGEEGGLRCSSDNDCPPDCDCVEDEDLGLSGNCRDPTGLLCGGTCDAETACPAGTSCKLASSGSTEPVLYACLPDSGAGGSGGSGGTAGTGGTDGSPTTPATESPVSCAQSGDVMAIADAFVRGGTSYQNTSYGTRPNLTIKSIVDLRFSRKIYIVFDLSSAPSTFNKASLVLTLIRHIESPRDPVNSSGPQPVDVYGITDNNDWDPDAPGLLETQITWNNAPRNDTAAGNAFEDSAGVPKLIPGYDFDLEGDGVVDLEGTKYALDITKYVRDSLTNDADKKITVLMAIATQMIDVEGSEFKSLDIPEGEMCDRPFLHFE